MEDREQESTNHLFTLVPSSYEWALRRFDAIERRIDRLLALIVGVTFGVPTVTTAILNSPTGDRQLLLGICVIPIAYIALAAAGLAVILSILLQVGRRRGRVRVLDLAGAQKRLRCQHVIETQAKLVEWAGADVRDNQKTVSVRARFADIVTWLFGRYGCAIGCPDIIGRSSIEEERGPRIFFALAKRRLRRCGWRLWFRHRISRRFFWCVSTVFFCQECISSRCQIDIPMLIGHSRGLQTRGQERY